MTDVETLKKKAEQLFIKRQFPRAIALYLEAIEKCNKDDRKTRVVLYSNLSAAYNSNTQYQQAFDQAIEAEKIDPSFPRLPQRKVHALTGVYKFDEALEIAGEVKELQDYVETKKAYVASLNGMNKEYDVMMDWLRSCGVTFPDVELAVYGSGSNKYRGLRATTDIRKGQIFMEIPLECLITSVKAKESALGQKLQKSGLTLTSNQTYHAAYLLNLRKEGTKNFLFPYIQCIPQDFSQFPVNYNADQLAWLRGSWVPSTLQKRKEDVEADYKIVCQVDPTFKHSLEDFQWARSVVVSRVFNIGVFGMNLDALCPLADMLNHSLTPNCTWEFNNDLRAFTVTASRDIQKGEEIQDSYGLKDNTRFFVNYGFCLSENPHNETLFFIPGFNYIKIGASYTLPATMEGFHHLRKFVSTKKPEKVGDMKIMDLANEEKKNNPDKVLLRKPISIENELQCLSLLWAAAGQTLSQYPTSIADDLKLLKTDLQSYQYNCVTLRLGEKQILTKWQQTFEIVKNLVEQPPQKRQKMVKDYAKQSGDLADYVRLVWQPLLKKA